MTLEESIKHCEDVADYDCFTDDQRKCSEEHRQLADWLRELKERREKAQLSVEDATFDCVSRQEAITVLVFSEETKDIKCEDMRNVLKKMPSASTELSNNSPKLDNKNGELISRQDAIKYFSELWDCIRTIGDREEWEDICVTTANEIKSAQPERKKGKWLRKEVKGIPFYCSVCTGRFDYEWKFCPNCGADMREGEEG